MARIQVKFWLDDKNERDLEVLDAIRILKDDREFTESIRVGIALYFTLKRGQVDYFNEYFPDIAELFRGEGRSQVQGEAFEKFTSVLERVVVASGNPQPVSVKESAKPMLSAKLDEPTAHQEVDESEMQALVDNLTSSFDVFME